MSKFTILMYHIVSAPKSLQEKRYACPPERLYKHMKHLRKNGYNIISLDDMLHSITNKINLPEKTVVITLDDGFGDNFENAFPVFQEFGIPATIFLASGLMGKTNVWMHNNGFPQRTMLTWEQIREMHDQGILFGAHTVTHTKLPEISPTEMLTELVDSKKQIEDNLGVGVQHFAYPYGLFDDAVRATTVKAEFKTACSTRSGFNNSSADLFSLRRLEIYGTDSVRALMQKITFGVNDSNISFPVKYYMNRLKERLR